ncbi:MAG: tRNA epoxyqueuosine(34) reductase QueG [Gemmatimonadota bacterium]
MATTTKRDDLDLRARIQERALELGFDQVGFAPADPPAHAETYLRWLREGLHGEMGYMARGDAVRRRVDPGRALPGCRSIVLVSLSYASSGEEAGAGDPLRPIVARYARGRDYHDVFEERLRDLADAILEMAPDARLKPYVDYGPVLERDHAQRAGLGWIGKNTVLIDPELGSYLLLGELLTTLYLEPDEPFTADRCGTCTRCIAACPTGAIRGPRELDARLCISYLTIELRGPIPVELRPLIGSRVFGCDICQEVCPWNEEAPPGDCKTLALGRPVAPESLITWAEELLALDEETFRVRYRDTALRRPGRHGLLRNVCVGLGNSGRAEAVPILIRALRDSEPLVRGHAAWALGQLGGPESKVALRRRLARGEEEWVRREVETALEATGAPGAR